MNFFSKTRILGTIIFCFFATMLLFISSCQKDLKEELLPHETSIDFRDPDSEENAPNPAQLLAIWQDFRQKHTIDEQIAFYQRNGFLKWSEALILKETPQENFLFSVPSVKDDRIESVLFAWSYNNNIKYVHVSRADLGLATGKILEKYGPNVATLMIMSFLKHEKNFGNYYSIFLREHFSHPDIQAVFEGVHPRGLCLIEVELQQPNDDDDDELQQPNDDDDSDPRDFVYYYNPDNNEHDEQFSNDGAIIHGNSVSYNTTVYHFWAWCPDEEDQNGQYFNWTTNIRPSASNGNSGGIVATTPTVTLEDIQEQNWLSFLQNFNTPPTRGLIEEAAKDFLEETGLSLEEFVRFGGMDCVDVTSPDEFVTEASFDKDCAKKMIEEIKWQKLQDILAENPWAFIEKCLAQNPDLVPAWEDLAAFVPGQDIIDLLHERDEDWELQTLTNAGGSVLNVDHYGVTFNDFPNGMNAEQFFTHVQQNFMQFDNDCGSTFNFDNSNIDGPLWTSNNPVGTIFDIAIIPNSGAVVTSQFENSPNSCFCWTFTTLNTNFSDVGSHPVSGNRQFGLTQNNDGTWTFYTRGVDRAYLDVFGFANTPTFNGANFLWNCIMGNVQDFVNPGGNSSTTFGNFIRPDWEQIKDKILSLPASELLECVESN